MFIVRGVNVYPGQIDHLLSQIPRLGSEYQVFLERGSDGKDYMTVRVERAEGVSRAEDKRLASELEHTINHKILVSGKVEIVDFQSLPRTERKSKRIFDNR